MYKLFDICVIRIFSRETIRYPDSNLNLLPKKASFQQSSILDSSRKTSISRDGTVNRLRLLISRFNLRSWYLGSLFAAAVDPVLIYDPRFSYPIGKNSRSRAWNARNFVKCLAKWRRTRADHAARKRDGTRRPLSHHFRISRLDAPLSRLDASLRSER